VKSRRLFALIAVLAVAWGSLWPLISTAGPKSQAIPSFICTQSGFQHPSAPLGDADKFHCPLCVVSVDAALPALPAADSWVALQPVRIIDAARAVAFHPPSAAQPPPSRAPPALP
jgi:hypothetical protein